jgi:hypothetical protein
MFPMNRKVLAENPVTIEYDSRRKRVRKECKNSFEARALYARLFKSGRNPAVVYKEKSQAG